MNKIGDRVQLTRLASTTEHGTIHATGILLSPLEVGNYIVIDTTEGRDTVDYRRCLRTSRIVAIDGDRIHTTNSIYTMESA